MKRKIEIPLWVWELYWVFSFIGASIAGSLFGVIISGLLIVLPLFHE